MLKIISIVFLLLLSVNANENKLPYEVALDKATHAVHLFHKMMKTNIKKSLQKGGLVEAANFCINNSVGAISKLNKTLAKDNISIKRVSLKNRNPKSYPKSNEIDILKSFDLLGKSSVYLPNIVQVSGDDEYKVYFAATMSKRTCKKCHGPKNSINKKVIKLLEKRYPSDKAFGFSAGEVRGAVVVTVKSK